MKRRYWILALLPALCVLLLSACSKRTKNVLKPVGQEKASAAASIALTVSSARYRAEYFSSDKLSIVSAAAADGGSVYLWGRNFQNEVEANWLIWYNPDKTVKESRLELSEGGYITALDVSEGEAYYLERVDAEDGTAAWFLHAAQEETKLDWANESNLFENLVVSGDTAYFTDGTALYTCSLPDGVIQSTAHAETELTTILQKADGKIAAYCEDTGSLYELDGDALAKTGTLPLLFYNSKLLPRTNSGFDCLVLGQAVLFGWNIEEETATQLLSFDTYGLVPNNISALAPLEDGSFVGAAWKSGELEDRLFWLSPSDALEEANSEKVLKLAGLGRPMVLSSAIADFKELRPEYTVEYTDYAELYRESAVRAGKRGSQALSHAAELFDRDDGRLAVRRGAQDSVDVRGYQRRAGAKWEPIIRVLRRNGAVACGDAANVYDADTCRLRTCGIRVFLLGGGFVPDVPEQCAAARGDFVHGGKRAGSAQAR